MNDVTTASPSALKPSVDLAAVKVRQQAMWASGDFSVIGTTLQIVGETLCEAVDLQSTARVLDVACGNGNAALAAARRWCDVTGLDYVPSLLRGADARARGEHLPLRLVEGDAEHLPFGDGEFDVALSTFGIMFAPDHPQAAREIARVVKPGGSIGLASWTPEGFIGQLLKTVGSHVPPPAGVASPIQWGIESRIRELFPDVRGIQCSRRNFVFRYRSIEHFVDVFQRYYGPTHKAFGALDADGKGRLAADIASLIMRFNGTAATVAVPAEYLEVVITR